MKTYSETEKSIQQAIMQYLRYKGYYCMRLNSGRIRTQAGGLVKLMEAGTPDLLAFRPMVVKPLGKYEIDVPLGITVMYFIEVKAGKNKPTYLQEMKMKELETFGARCIVANSVEELEKLNI